MLAPEPNLPLPTLDEIDVVRHREITSKAVSAILLLVLKWFKVSRTSRWPLSVDGVMLIDWSRCDEVSPSRRQLTRHQLFATHSQDVWAAGSDPDSCVQGRFTREQVCTATMSSHYHSNSRGSAAFSSTACGICRRTRNCHDRKMR